MKTTHIIATIMLFALISSATATHEQINETLYIYNKTTVSFEASESMDTNIDQVVIDHAICTKMKCSIGSNNDYSFDYELIWAPNETSYLSSIITVKQETYDSSYLGLKKHIVRTLLIDAVEVATYNTSVILTTGTHNVFEFNVIDRSITFGAQTVNNATLFFTKMIITDQYNHLYNNSGGYVKMKFTTLGMAGEGFDSLKLGGFTGTFLSIIKKIPIIGNSLYNVLYPVVVVIQYSLDFSFAFLNLIIYDWYYALLVMECMCLFRATQHNNYIDIISTYINTHAQIIEFVYHKVMLPLINLSINILVTIKNMIQWW